MAFLRRGPANILYHYICSICDAKPALHVISHFSCDLTVSSCDTLDQDYD